MPKSLLQYYTIQTTRLAGQHCPLAVGRYPILDDEIDHEVPAAVVRATEVYGRSKRAYRDLPVFELDNEIQKPIQIQNILVAQVKPATSCKRSGCI